MTQGLTGAGIKKLAERLPPAARAEFERRANYAQQVCCALVEIELNEIAGADPAARTKAEPEARERAMDAANAWLHRTLEAGEELPAKGAAERLKAEYAEAAVAMIGLLYSVLESDDGPDGGGAVH